MPIDDSTENGPNNRSRHPTTESNETKDSAISSGYPSTSSTSSEGSRISPPPAPDGGWGWMVVFGAFIISMICDGCSLSFGILFSEWHKYFDESKWLTAVIGSLFVGVPLIVGPIASSLTTQYGCQKVTIAGGIITSIGFILSVFAPSVVVLCITLGVIAGIGISFSTVTSMVIVAFYFEKKRALATGLAVCGAGIGTFIFAPLTEYFINEYGWRGSMLLLGGINLNVVVCGMLFRPLKFSPQEKRKKAMQQFERISSTISKQSIPSKNRSCFTSAGESRPDSLSHSDKEDDDDLATAELLSHSQIQLPTYVQHHNMDITPEIIAEHRKLTGHSVEQCLRRHFCSLNYNRANGISKPDQRLTLTSQDDVVFENESNKHQKENRVDSPKKHVHALNNGNGVCSSNDHLALQRSVWQKKSWDKHKDQKNAYSLMMYRSDVFYRGNLLKLPSHPFHASCPELYRSHIVTEEEEESLIFKYCPMLKALKISRQVKEILKTMFDPKVLKHPAFLIFAISNFMLFFWTDVPYIFLADHAIETKLSDNENNTSLVISVLGIVSTLGQIIYGVIGDTSVNLTILYSFSCILCGLSVALVPLVTQFWALCVLGGLYGLFISANYSLCTVMLADYVGIEKLTNAYGLIMLIQGVANLGGPPIAGYIGDVTGRYVLAFYAAGILMALSGVVSLFILMTKQSSKCFGLSACCGCKRAHNKANRDQSVTRALLEPAQLLVVERESSV